MQILEGSLPDDKAWRALVILSPGERPGITWQLGLSLATANNGELVTAIIISPGDESEQAEARQTLSEIRELSMEDDPIHTVIIEAPRYEQSVRRLIQTADIDLLLARADAPRWHNLERMPCAVAAVRGEAYSHVNGQGEEGAGPVERFKGKVLVPTSGGPNSVHALGVLLPLTYQDIHITALYIAPEHLGPNEEALGHARLRQTLDFIDGRERIESKLVMTRSIIEGIVQEARDEYDLVIIGASRESSLDKVLFGDITGTVVRESKVPVVVFRGPTSRIAHLFTDLNWAIQRIVPRLTIRERTAAYVRIRRDARPDIDFYVLIGLAAGIAALGMLLDSAAVVIGAMLVAPLMSPIAGTGLAMVQGDVRFLRLSVGAVVRGSIIALIMSLFVGFIPLRSPITDEVLARTSPTLLDLGVALLSGVAVAYALSRSSATAALPGVAIAAALVPPLSAVGITMANGMFRESFGALLLYITNLIAISVASAFVFLVLGFRPTPTQKARRMARARSTQGAVLLLVAITVVLAFTTYRLAQESAEEARIQQLAEESVRDITGAELSDIEIDHLEEGGIHLSLIVRSSTPIPHRSVVELQEYMATELQKEVGLNLTVINASDLDPFQPPTFTPTPTATNTPTLGPTLTPTTLPTDTPSPTPSFTPTPSPTATPTATPTPSPTSTPTYTPSPTPRIAIVRYEFGLNMRAEPASDADLIRFLPVGTEVILLDGTVDNLEGSWQEVMYDGQAGWVLGGFLGTQEG